jgi:hypothetical protein
MVIVVVIIGVVVVMVGHRIADGRTAYSANHGAHRAAYDGAANRTGHATGDCAA